MWRRVPCIPRCVNLQSCVRQSLPASTLAKAALFKEVNCLVHQILSKRLRFNSRLRPTQKDNPALARALCQICGDRRVEAWTSVSQLTHRLQCSQALGLHQALTGLLLGNFVRTTLPWIHIYIYIDTHISICRYICTYVHIYIYIHTYSYIHTPNNWVS